MKTKYTQEFTTTYPRTFEEATRIANLYTKGLNHDEEESDWLPEYNTAIKIETSFPTDVCWVITNRFDPDIRKANGL